MAILRPEKGVYVDFVDRAPSSGTVTPRTSKRVPVSSLSAVTVQP